MLHADIQVQLGDFNLDISLDVDDGEVVGLLGPNGAGKTTALRTIAGLHPLDDGRIELDDQVLDDATTGTFVPTAQRPIGVVFQDYLLFPRLTALDNVAFGLRARGRTKADARAQAHEWLERFGLADQARARPRTLSGGQAQRVALARALAIDPHLLLLDEPLAALDAATRRQVRSDLRHHLATFDGARLLVTHDPVDALVLADRLVIVEDGRITQTGNAAEVVARPASPYVAQLVGVNLLHGKAQDAHTVRLPSGAELTVADPVPPGDVALAIRPQAVALHRHHPEGSPRNTWKTTVVDIEPNHDRVRVTLTTPIPLTAEITPAALADLSIEPGTPLWATTKATDITPYPR